MHRGIPSRANSNQGTNGPCQRSVAGGDPSLGARECPLSGSLSAKAASLLAARLCLEPNVLLPPVPTRKRTGRKPPIHVANLSGRHVCFGDAARLGRATTADAIIPKRNRFIPIGRLPARPDRASVIRQKGHYRVLFLGPLVTTFDRSDDIRPGVQASGYCRQHFLYFLPLPHGQGSLRPTFSRRGDT